MGAVYEALHEAIERRVAIKILHSEYARNLDMTKRFFNEARAVNRIGHPSLVQISDHGQLADGTSYIVMEYLSGETLSCRLRRFGGRLPSSVVIHIGWQIAAALTAAHDKGIVHRDLKPDNIMLVPDQMVAGGERAKLLDFGIAKLAADAKGTNARTGTNVVMGTPAYMSPEQCRGAGIVDAKTDVYSLGVMLYQMLAGHPPFTAEGIGELIGMHLFREPQPLEELAAQAPARLVALVRQLMAKERETRPTMRQIAELMERLQTEPSNIAAQPPSPAAASLVDSGQATMRPPQNSTLGRSTGQQERTSSHRVSRWAVATIAGSIGAVTVVWAIGHKYFVRDHKVSVTAPAQPLPVVPHDIERHIATAGFNNPHADQPGKAMRELITASASKGSATTDNLGNIEPKIPQLASARLPAPPTTPVPSQPPSESNPSLTSRVSLDRNGANKIDTAQKYLDDQRWGDALRTASVPRIQAQDRPRALRIIGVAACMLGKRPQVEEVISQMRSDAAGLKAIEVACKRSGLVAPVQVDEVKAACEQRDNQRARSLYAQLDPQQQSYVHFYCHKVGISVGPPPSPSLTREATIAERELA